MANCIETSACPPVNPLDVLNLYDIWFGVGTTIVMMALIIAIITAAIYIRQRSLPMLAILITYEVAVFGSIVTSQYVNSQYQIAVYVIGLGLATAVMMMIYRTVKE